MKNIMIIGNLGYIGPLVVSKLRDKYPNSFLIGFDIGYFEHVLSSVKFSPETKLNAQYYGDVRNFPYELLENIDSIVYLAAISNDPMGNEFQKITREVNHLSAVKIANKAKDLGVKDFVFASSCSVYGFTEDGMRNEHSDLNPLTAYAKSKIDAENDLENIANQDFKITCLRFATACGFSPRLRLDLVLNDFVASAVANNSIDILSDGKPWRPLIHVKDMAVAIDWAIIRKNTVDDNFLAINAGSNEWNYQIQNLAEGVKKVIPKVNIEINHDAAPDKRSYQVDFTNFKNLAPDYYPAITLEDAVEGLYKGLMEMKFKDQEFRNSKFIRLNVLKSHIKSKVLNRNLRWKN